MLSGDEAVAPHEYDALFHLRQRLRAVVIPGSEAQVQAVMRLCVRDGVLVVPRRAGTSLCGGALPVADGIVMSLNCMKQLAIEADARQAVAGPGGARPRCLAKGRPGRSVLRLVMGQASPAAANGYSPALDLRLDAGGAVLCELDGE